MDLTTCPDCAAAAEIRWLAVMDSTDGPVEHAKILCVNRHWFFLPVDALGGAATPDPLSLERGRAT